MALQGIIDGVIYGDQCIIKPSHLNYGKFMINSMLRHSNKKALINGVSGEQITFGKMVQRILNTADSLTRWDVKRDEVVAICSENRMEFLITSIAVWCCGATVTFLNETYSKNDMEHAMIISKPKYVFFSPDTYENYYEIIANTTEMKKIFVFGNKVSVPGLIHFEELSKTNVDINSFKTAMDEDGEILQGYGMTEATGALMEETATHLKPGSVGRIVSGNIAKIVDIETRKILGPNQEGEVCIKGPALFEGYIGKNLSESLDEDGFFNTGDICYYDEEGYFFYVGRIKELIKNVAPSELEAILLQNPSVKDAGVVGKPDSEAGELSTAFVVKNLDVDVTSKELINFVAAKVSIGIYIEEIPKVPSGKILRRILRDFLK